MKKIGITILIGLLAFMAFISTEKPMSEDIQPEKLFSIHESNGNVTMNVAGAVQLDANEDGARVSANQSATIESEGVSNTGSESEVSFGSSNPMLFTAGESSFTEKAATVNGFGVQKIYEMKGGVVNIDGFKNQVVIKGYCDVLSVNGFGCSVRADSVGLVDINGFSNKVYSDQVKTLTVNGFANKTSYDPSTSKPSYTSNGFFNSIKKKKKEVL